MSERLRHLLEALQGMLQEQKALQAYATDFVDAHNRGDLKTMLDALAGSLRLFGISLKDFEDEPGMDAVLRDLNRVRERMERMEVRGVRGPHRRH